MLDQEITMRVTQLPNGSFGQVRYDVNTGELWGYARWPATVEIDKGKMKCYGHDCDKYARKYEGFQCKHVKALKQFLHIS